MRGSILEASKPSLAEHQAEWARLQSQSNGIEILSPPPSVSGLGPDTYVSLSLPICKMELGFQLVPRPLPRRPVNKP